MKKTIVIIGGTGGIGHAAAKTLAQHGNDLIIQGLSAEKGRSIVQELKNDKGSIAFIPADVSSLVGIKKLADEVRKLTNKIDALVLSTGALNSTRRESKDGYDQGFVINYLNKFILNSLLIEELKRGEGKIIIVGAPVMKKAKINFEDLQLKNSYTLTTMMGQAMLANFLHAQEFAKRNGTHPSINIVFPGLVKTGITRNLQGFMKIVINLILPLIGNSAEKGAANIIDLIEGADENESGYFFPKVANVKVKEKINYDPLLAERLWEESLRFFKV